MLALAACTASGRGNGPVPRGDTPLAHTRAAPRATYTVTAPLLHRQKSHVVLACQAILTSLPPAGCSGVRVDGYDFSRLRHVTRFRSAWWTGPYVLVGTWDGRRLTLAGRVRVKRVTGF